ncbi:18.0 kDa class I heat shock protein-like [Macadamia integrifolia]|uniref:18.0 kDa class I heat shock protein-like n=1 Tax=Macadamia integrifolia TaxID=60698 RepID=UPI001C52A7D8|nr:18.0 kDa class I heat shock protein-like [Macadamia integrifolia]
MKPMRVEKTMTLWVFLVVVAVGFSATAASFFPSGGKPWKSFEYPFRPQYEGDRMDRMYMNQHATQTSDRSEIVSHCKKTPKAYVYTLEIPGLKREDVKVEAEDGLLRIKGEEKKTKKQNGEVHWSYGQFWKQIPLADDANSDDINTDVKHGVLTINVPRRHHKGKPHMD